ncbi:hypothetical protein RCL1_000810 [Eukaryota sp. TZLM3-RCL]
MNPFPEPFFFLPDSFDCPTKYVSEDRLLSLPNVKVFCTSRIYNRENVKISPPVLIKEATIIRADLGKVTLGTYSLISNNCFLSPPPIETPSLSVGTNVFIGENCKIEARTIYSHVYISKDCTLEQNCIINPNVFILPNTRVGKNSIVPTGVVIKGDPFVIIGYLPEIFQEIMIDYCKRYYNSIQVVSS